MTAILAPTVIEVRRAYLASDQLSLLVLISSATHPKFIQTIEDLLEGCSQPTNLEDFEKMIATRLSSKSPVPLKEKKDLLLRLSSPAKNSLLW